MATPFITDAEATQKIQQSYNQLDGKMDVISSGYRGTIARSDTPTEDGIYTPTEAGTYTNAGGLVYDPDGVDKGFDVKFIKTGSEWVKSVVEFSQLSLKWKPLNYNANQIVFNNGALYVSTKQMSELEVPGETYEWKPLNDKVTTGNNIFNLDRGKYGYGLGVTDDEVVNPSNLITDYLLVQKNTPIFLTYSSERAEISARLAIYDKNFNRLDVVNPFSSGGTITNQNAYYFRVNLSISVAENLFQIEYGEKKEYSTYYNVLEDFIKVKKQNVLGLNEIEDGVFPLDGEKMAFFGDSITQDAYENSHYPYIFEKNTKVRSINQGYGGTSMSKHIDPDFEVFSLTNLLNAKLSGVYTSQENVISSWEIGSPEEQIRAGNYTLQLDKFKQLDFNSLYAITIMYGANDHGKTVGSITDIDEDGATFIGAYNWVIKTLQENYPELGIILLTPIYREHAPGVTDRTPLFVQATKDVAELNNLPVFDMYHLLGFNKYNWDTYSDDGLHPNFLKGQKRMGERITAYLKSIL